MDHPIYLQTLVDEKINRLQREGLQSQALHRAGVLPSRGIASQSGQWLRRLVHFSLNKLTERVAHGRRSGVSTQVGFDR